MTALTPLAARTAPAADPAALTLGTVLRRWQAEAFEFTLARYRADEALTAHVHEAAYICINLGAAFDEHPARLTAQPVAAGAVVTHPAGDTHANRFGPQGGWCLNLHRRDATGRAWQRATGRHGVRHDAGLQPVVAAVQSELACADDRPEVEGLVFAEWAAVLLDRLAAAAQTPSHRPGAQRALDALREMPAEPWTLDRLAAIAGLHPTHLARQVRRDTGRTLGEHLRRRRVLMALDQLRRSTASIVDVALQCGFADQAHLTRTMRRLLGVTPGRGLRRSAR